MNRTDKYLRHKVKKALQLAYGDTRAITEAEWETAKEGALQDAYANILCLTKSVSPEYFVQVMAKLIHIQRRI